MSRGPIGELLEHVERRTLDAALVERLFDALLDGRLGSVEVGAFAVAMRLAGESAEHLVAGARALRRVMHAVDAGQARVVDTCGTGGDASGTLNLSTAAAFVVAAAGETVAKHGNRSVSSRAGSADVLEALGVALDVPVGAQRGVLEAAGVAFLLAPAHHPALRHAAEARRALGTRTIFNALGPLANPARATHQVVGVYDDGLRVRAARALAELGTERAWVVRSQDGLDELSPASATRVSVVEGGRVDELEVAPEDFGLARGSLDALRGGDARENAEALERLLRGEPHPATPAVVLNAAAALVVAQGLAPRAAAARAAELVATGAAHARLERLRAATRDARPRAPGEAGT